MNAAQATADILGNATELLDTIAKATSTTPRNIQRACLQAIEKLDLVQGYMNRAEIRARIDGLKSPKAPVTPIAKASG